MTDGKRQKPKLVKVEKPAQSYFVSNDKSLEFVSSGCTLLDCALGGGFPLGRVANIVGDKSTAKTALATETIINFLQKYPTGTAAYRDTEAAFDTEYAQAMGMPIKDVDFGNPDKPVLTIEEFGRDVDRFLDRQAKVGKPGIYVLDSLDALSDEAEMESDFGKATYGTGKARGLSVFFRKLARKCELSNVLLVIVSQVRENIGVAFGEKYRRSGGKALDHYSSQILWLANIKTLKKTIKKVERPYAFTIRAKVKKNKAGLPQREVEFDFLFGFGIDDVGACLTWLEDIDRLDAVGLSSAGVDAYLKDLTKVDDADYRSKQRAIAAETKRIWAEVETAFLPTRRKYAEAT